MALMVRVLNVVMGYRWYAALFVVVLFGDAVAQIILLFTPLPIFNIMGGVRLTDSERLIQNVACGITFWGVLTLPVWFVGAVTVWVRSSWFGSSRRCLQWPFGLKNHSLCLPWPALSFGLRSCHSHNKNKSCDGRPRAYCDPANW